MAALIPPLTSNATKQATGQKAATSEQSNMQWAYINNQRRVHPRRYLASPYNV